ncbi:hypothetical protein OOZ54_12950 [Rhodopseudomonas palustris]|uniref:hypothetical protein n=1 Tax=Rhodopseudomonas palustris TaxID=1076 RepID=UPI0022F0EEFE|nr:hypothetical protein [Rhodopseudomonas palustris]WBU27603.1 hypothetical protein OOZ54_12950 [Rhodopseudomonas palustris]
MTSFAQVLEQIEGLPRKGAAELVRSAREKFNQRRLGLVAKAEELTRQLAEAEGSEEPNEPVAAKIRELREEVHTERQVVHDAACELNALLLQIEGKPQPAPSVKPDWSIQAVK